MTQLPILVDNLINWYIWKAKITNINFDYLHRIEYDSQYNTDKLVEHDTFFLYHENQEDIKMKVQYRSFHEPQLNLDHFYIFRYNESDHIRLRVALLSSKYYYSRGSSKSSKSGMVFIGSTICDK
ncbi:MAG: hypothetical protein WD512_12330 [Candidatus Paceibacterota bacterium]